MKICFEIYDLQPSGYIFICSKKDSSWQDYPFNYPEQAREIESKVNILEKSGHDVYFSMFTFRRPKRREEYAQSSPVLYADLDDVEPSGIESTLRPSIAWKSSAERYQAIWMLDESLSVSEHKKLNQALTYYLKADRGGWDITQVLRVPGSMNYKYSPPQRGSILWDENKIYNKKIFEKLPEPQSEGVGNLGDFVKLRSQYRKQIPQKISRMLQYPENRISVGKRSEILWAIESELVKAKIPLQDIVTLIQGSNWNKYRGRHDELKRITTEIEKVYSQSRSSRVEEPVKVYRRPEDKDDTDGLPIKEFNEFMGSVRSRPGWMIKDIWLRRSHGIIAGDPKTFKSTVAMDVAVSVASGKPLWGSYAVEDEGPVLIIQNENSEWIIQDRMQKLMGYKGVVGQVESKIRKKTGEVDRLFDITFAPELPIAFLNNYGFSFSDPDHLEKLEEYIVDFKPTLIMFDPLYLMFDGEMNSARELNPTLQWLLDLKNNYNSSVMLIHHWNKNGASSRGGQRMLGSVALHGWTESGLFLQQKEKSAVVQDRENENDKPVVEVIMEREFRSAGIMPRLALNISHDLKIEVGGTVKTRSFATSIFELLIEKGSMSVMAIAKELGSSRDKVRAAVENDPFFIIEGTGVKIKN